MCFFLSGLEQVSLLSTPVLPLHDATVQKIDIGFSVSFDKLLLSVWDCCLSDRIRLGEIQLGK